MKWYRLYKESNDSDFVIKNGVLKKYTGRGGNVVIPDGVTSIGDYAFNRCPNLTSITIPDSVTSIGEWAFNLCISLTEVTIKGDLKSIGKWAFYLCKNLKSIQFTNKTTKEAKDLLKNAVEDISIAKGLKNRAFVVLFKYSHRTEDEQEFSANSPEEARRKFEKWASDMECSEDFDFEFIDAKEA